jgi:hypothetical protein
MSQKTADGQLGKSNLATDTTHSKNSPDPWESRELDDNDCWMYQLELERCLVRVLPDPKMHGRYLAMLKLLANQARRNGRE